MQAGLFAALVPMAMYAVLGTSRLLSVSTTTPIAILCATAIGAALQSDPGPDPLTAAATLSILVGAMLIAVAAGIAASSILALEAAGVSVVGAIQGGVPTPMWRRRSTLSRYADPQASSPWPTLSRQPLRMVRADDGNGPVCGIHAPRDGF